MHFRLHPFPYVLWRFYRKDKYSFPHFQQGVHLLPELGKFLFSLNYFKRFFFKYLPYKVCKTTFSIYVYILKISSKIPFTLQTIPTQFRRFSLKLQNTSLSLRDKHQKIWYFLWELRRDKRRQEQRDKQMFQFTLGVKS